MHLPDLDAARDRNRASFDQFMVVMLADQQSDPIKREVLERYYPQMLAAFESTHGAIRFKFECENTIAAAALTDRNELHLAFPMGRSNSLRVEELLFECDRLNMTSERLLEGRDRTVSGENVYGLVTYLLDILDTQASSKPLRPGEVNAQLNILETALTHARSFVTHSAQRRAKIRYALGMLSGLAGLAVGAIAYFLFFPHPEDAEIRLAGLCFTCGAIGSAISVLSRMTFGRLILDHEASRGELFALGIVRPLVGGVFGILFYLLSRSGLIPLREPALGQGDVPFYASAAFLAGFSERLAQDMLLRAESHLLPTSKQSENPETLAARSGAATD